jgi:hypothetical protein
MTHLRSCRRPEQVLRIRRHGRLVIWEPSNFFVTLCDALHSPALTPAASQPRGWLFSVARTYGTGRRGRSANHVLRLILTPLPDGFDTTIRAVTWLEIETTRVHHKVLAPERRTMPAITRFVAKTGRSSP